MTRRRLAKAMSNAPPIDLASPSGSIVLARHGEPALSRRIRLSAAEYRDWWARYEEGGILLGQTPPDRLVDIACSADVIFASTRLRAIETATAVCGEKTFVTDVAFIEAPLPPPPLPSFIRLSPKVWGFVARFCWWFFRYGEGGETRAEAEARAGAVADRLIAAAAGGQTVLVFAHGFFNKMIELQLKPRGWLRVEGRGYKYWSAKRFERG